MEILWSGAEITGSERSSRNSIRLIRSSNRLYVVRSLVVEDVVVVVEFVVSSLADVVA